MNTTAVGTTIVERIADREGVDPVDLNVLLYDVIDMDALDDLTNDTSDRRSQANVRIEFTYHGFEVTVVESGKIIIDERPPEANRDESPRKESVDG